MQEQEIIEGNAIIAVFDNYNIEYVNGKRYFTLDDMVEALCDEELHYHSSWDLLMPIVEKIENLKLSTETGDNIYFRLVIIENEVRIDKRNSRLAIWENLIDIPIDIRRHKKQAIWLVIVEFLKWLKYQK